MPQTSQGQDAPVTSKSSRRNTRTHNGRIPRNMEHMEHKLLLWARRLPESEEDKGDRNKKHKKNANGPRYEEASGPSKGTQIIFGQDNGPFEGLVWGEAFTRRTYLADPRSSDFPDFEQFHPRVPTPTETSVGFRPTVRHKPSQNRGTCPSPTFPSFRPPSLTPSPSLSPGRPTHSPSSGYLTPSDCGSQGSISPSWEYQYLSPSPSSLDLDWEALSLSGSPSSQTDPPSTPPLPVDNSVGRSLSHRITKHASLGPSSSSSSLANALGPVATHNHTPSLSNWGYSQGTTVSTPRSIHSGGISPTSPTIVVTDQDSGNLIFTSDLSSNPFATERLSPLREAVPQDTLSDFLPFTASAPNDTPWNDELFMRNLYAAPPVDTMPGDYHWQQMYTAAPTYFSTNMALPFYDDMGSISHYTNVSQDSTPYDFSLYDYNTV